MGKCLSCEKDIDGVTCGKMTKWTHKPGYSHYGPCEDCFCEKCRTEPKNDAKWRSYYTKHFII